jgi:UDP-N-acetylglucosamine:LPS N-acetylglucosamine transferase
MKKTLLVYGFHESGHYKAVKSLEEELASRGRLYETINIWRNKSKTVDELFAIFRIFAANGVKDVPAFLTSPKLLENLAKELPISQNLNEYDSIISTHHYSSFVLAEQKTLQKSGATLIDVHTNYTSFPLVEHKNIDYYVGAIPKIDVSERTRNKLVAAGIPVRKAFQYDGTPKEKIVLIMGGADGFGELEKIANFTKLLPNNYGYFIFCGRNDKVYKQLKRKFSQHSVLGYKEDLSSYLKQAMFVITKASGVTVAEAMNAKCIPIFAPPILCWEDEAAKYLSANGAGLYLPDFGANSVKAVKLLMKSKEQQALMKTKMNEFAKPEAAKTIAYLTESKLKVKASSNQPKLVNEVQNHHKHFATSKNMPDTASYLSKQILKWMKDHEYDNRD